MRNLLLPLLALGCAASMGCAPQAAVAVADEEPAPATLVVGNKGEDSVSFIDLDSGQERVRLATGKWPHEIATSPDGSEVAVVHYGANSVEIFHVDPPRAHRVIALGDNVGPHGILWTADNRLLVTTERSKTLSIVDLADDSVTAIPTGQDVSHMVAAQGSRAYTANMGSGTVSVIDLSAGRKVADLPAGETPEGLALSGDGRTLWVADRANATLFAFDTANMERVATIAVGDFPIRVAVSPDGRSVVTSNLMDGTLSIVDAAARKVVRTIRVNEGEAAAMVTILFAPDGRTIYAAETGKRRIAEVDLATGEVRRYLSAGEGADGLALAD
ncbi:YncE family protein [Sphingomicrobium arenosum]|uniref:YncE family protein n=1 Tax=Sphingomicrobium arenosum TaxID=2233861 RepID=UPI002240EC08|nr:beta-propeller fold lactonase family protein [Sphingomicrobium arenosum]